MVYCISFLVVPSPLKDVDITDIVFYLPVLVCFSQKQHYFKKPAVMLVCKENNINMISQQSKHRIGTRQHLPLFFTGKQIYLSTFESEFCWKIPLWHYYTATGFLRRVLLYFRALRRQVEFLLQKCESIWRPICHCYRFWKISWLNCTHWPWTL